MDLCDKVMSLLFNTLPRSVIAFFLTSKPVLISWLHSLSLVILEPRKIKSVTASTFSPSVCREVMRLDAMILVFWMLSFKPAFSLSSFTLSPMVFPVVTYGYESWTVKKVEHKKFMLLNCGARKTWESLELQGDQRRSRTQSERKPTLKIHWKDWWWSWSSNPLATRCKEQTHWKGPWCWERLRVGGEGDDRGQDGWMASPTQWTWV